MKLLPALFLLLLAAQAGHTQNIGLGIASPTAKLHIKGAADVSQLIIDANAAQSNTQPLIKLRNSAGAELMSIHSDNSLNVFLGNSAGRVNNAVGGGQRNTFLGSVAGYANQTGYLNTASGWSALHDNTGGHNNSAYGAVALNKNTSGNENTAVGAGSIYENLGGSYNTAVGGDALRYTTASSYNTSVGYRAGYSYNYGWNNVFIGANSDAAGPDYYNVVAIGQGAIATAPSQVRLGNGSTTSFFCQGAYAGTTASGANMHVNSSGQIMRSTSSARYKTKISDLEINTALLHQLRPVSYQSISDGRRHFGLIAEEVAAIVPQLAEYAKEKDVVPGSTSDKLVPDAVQYSLLSVLLLKELQEQKKLIDKLQEQVRVLNNKMEKN